MELDRIFSCILKAYGSLESPNFSFVSEAISARPYQAVLETLGQEFTLDEDTDPNDDVSFGYTLKRGQDEFWLQLSMVGPFAVLMRDGRLIDECFTDDTSRSIISSVEAFGLTFLERKQLEMPIALALFNAEPENVRIYQVLFQDTDVLPWV